MVPASEMFGSHGNDGRAIYSLNKGASVQDKGEGVDLKVHYIVSTIVYWAVHHEHVHSIATVNGSGLFGPQPVFMSNYDGRDEPAYLQIIS